MCRLVYIVESRGPYNGRPGTESETYSAGDVVAVEEDGTFLGTEVEPATVTTGNISVIEVPGVRAHRMRYLMREYQDALEPQRLVMLRPGHPDGDSYERNILRKRQYGIDRNLLAIRHQTNFRRGRSISDTEANIESAVRDYARPGSPPVDRGTIDRNL